MTCDFINPLMLIGLVGVTLPLLVHFLSKKKYDIVDWGAMQFLELGRETRRKIRLEELLLLLMRMGLIALLAVAMARPWIEGGIFSGPVSSKNRDVVFVIDGSASMGYRNESASLHEKAIDHLHRFLEELRPGDTVALLDAREQVRAVIDEPTRDFNRVRQKLNDLPPPAGSSNLVAAASHAVDLLSSTSHLEREIIIFTDRQAQGWRADDKNRWQRFDDARSMASVNPRLWVFDVGGRQLSETPNFSVDRLILSRELTLRDVNVRISTTLRSSGSHAPRNRNVTLEIDGQPIRGESQQVTLSPGKETDVEFQYRFSTAGSHLVSVVTDDDALSSDNRSDAVVTVVDALPVVMFDGDPELESTGGETYFASRALTAETNNQPWVMTSVVPWDRWSPDDLRSANVVVLANVDRLDEQQASLLIDYVREGGGLLLFLGDRIDASSYNHLLFGSANGLLPVTLEQVVSAPGNVAGVRIQPPEGSIGSPMTVLMDSNGGLSEARFSQWWQIHMTSPSADITGVDAQSEKHNSQRSDRSNRATPIAALSLTTGDPLLLTGQLGRGRIALLTVPLDADWSNLPAKPDFVPFLHELIFELSLGTSKRNVDAGETLYLPLANDAQTEGGSFFGPGDRRFPAKRTDDELRPAVQLSDTRIPGVYRFQEADRQGESLPPSEPEYFVVNYDRRESDLRLLDDAELGSLTENARMRFMDDVPTMKQEMFRDGRKSEYWRVALLVFLLILVCEVAMTRRLVRGAHEVVAEEQLSAN